MKKNVYHIENPFLSDMAGVMPDKQYRAGNRIVFGDPNDPDKYATDEDGKIIIVNGKGPLVKGPIDTGRYYKVYSHATKRILALSRAGIEMFHYIASNLQPKNDRLDINTDEARDSLGYKSAVSIYNGLDSLEKQGIIAKAYSGKRSRLSYWINPDVIFNGNRVVLSKRINNATNEADEIE